jgi:VanZ family protein
MKNLLTGRWKWLPGFMVMALIFTFSSLPGNDLPHLGILDFLVKKSAHVAIYAILATAIWYAMDWKLESRGLVWLLTVLYAITDEFHQSFIRGRHPWWLDVLLFDAVGAALGLWLVGRILRSGTTTKTPISRK